MQFRTLGLMAFMIAGSRLVLQAAEAPKDGRKVPNPSVRAAAPGSKTAPAKGAPASAAFQRDVAAVALKYCGACHGEKAATGGINFQAYKTEASVVKARDTWEKVARNVQDGHMPPKNMPQLSAKEKTAFVSWIEAKLSQADCDVRDPGRVTLRRLNRAEYNNTIRDLFGVDVRPADDFPSDDVGYGFDNIGDVLSISPLLMEKYLSAAEKVVEKAIVFPDLYGPTERQEAENLPTQADAVLYNKTGLLINKNGTVGTRFSFVKAGDYLLRVRAFGQQAGSEPVKMGLRLEDRQPKGQFDITNNVERAVFDVTATEAAPKVYETRVHVDGGRLRFTAAFLNDFEDPQAADPKQRDRNLVVDYLEVMGPLPEIPSELPESHKRIFNVAHDDKNWKEAAHTILAGFAKKAYRRPVTGDEVDRLVRYVEQAHKEGDSFERGVGLAMEAALVSPSFLFRVELDRGSVKDATKAFPLTDYELASRLSYFLWSSMPDDELFALADKGQLQKKEVLAEQVRRMLQDPRAHALTENFGMQWLTLRGLKGFNPDPARFPDFNEGLRSAMLKETELFFESIVQEDRNVLDFLDAKYTFLNEPLAKHYGIDWVKGPQFRKVVLPDDSPRGGVLTQASILCVTSNPTRTSPVKRGKWILEQILGTPPPPPPPNVPELKEQGMLTGTLRQRMEQHRKDPSCASCHARMDALGFGFENFDAVGAWRTQDGDSTIDSSGVLPDGTTFSGPNELKAVLKQQQKTPFVRNLSQAMMTYAIGRGLEYYDRCTVDQIVRTLAPKQYRFSALVTDIVASDPFRMRRGEGEVK